MNRLIMQRIMLFVLALAASPCWAQFTTVTGTVTDPNGLPYAQGTVTPLLVTSGTPIFTATGSLYLAPLQASGLDNTGTFRMTLADNTALTPAGTKWNFTVCSAGGSVPFSFGKGPICFTLAAPITISGSSQSITSNLNAVAPALTVNFGGGGSVSGSGTSGFIPAWTSSATLGNSLLQSGTSLQAQSGLTAPVGVLFINQDNGACVGTAAIPILNVSGVPCIGLRAEKNDQSGSAIGVSAAGQFQNQGAASAATLLMGVYTNVVPDTATTETRGIYSQALTNFNVAVTTQRAGLFFSGNSGGNTITTNEAGVFQTYVSGSGSINTNDYTLHVLSPTIQISGVMSTHVGVQIDDQIAGSGIVEAGTRPNSFGGIVNGVAGFQQNGTPIGDFCGTSTACSNTASPLTRLVYGQVTLSSASPSTAVVTGISPGFTSTTSYSCTATNGTTQANPIKVTNTSGSSVTFTGPNTVTDLVYYVCVGT